MSQPQPEIRTNQLVSYTKRQIEARDAGATVNADRVLYECIKANAELDLVSVRFAVDPELRETGCLNHKRKLVLAEVLRLVARSLDPSLDQQQTLGNLRQTRKKLDEAVRIGVGQMLERLRPREKLAHRLILWKANSNRAKDRALPAHQTSLIIGPNRLTSRAFQKLIEHEIKATNLAIGKGEYRSFMFLPLDELCGETVALLPYMRIAEKYHLLIVGSLPIANSLDAKMDAFRRWRFSITDVDADSYETLSHASIVLNHLIVREPFRNYFEAEPLTVGLEYAYAAQMTRYFQRKKLGQWYLPIVHPRIKARDMRTVNVVDRLDGWRESVEHQFNYAYTTTESQDNLEPGVRIYGGSTVFPEDAIDKESLGTQAVPLIQAQARAVKNRIYDQLQSELEKLIDGQYDEVEVRKKVRRYLDGMFLQKQIHGYEIFQVSKSETGVFHIKVEIRWSAGAEEFIIDATARPEKPDTQA